jgi:hypothetical protein
VIVSGPIQMCMICGNAEAVRPDGRGFPPDIAKRRLQKKCRREGCPCEPEYRAGLILAPRQEEK